MKLKIKLFFHVRNLSFISIENVRSLNHIKNNLKSVANRLDVTQSNKTQKNPFQIS